MNFGILRSTFQVEVLELTLGIDYNQFEDLSALHRFLILQHRSLNNVRLFLILIFKNDRNQICTEHNCIQKFAFTILHCI